MIFCIDTLGLSMVCHIQYIYSYYLHTVRLHRVNHNIHLGNFFSTSMCGKIISSFFLLPNFDKKGLLSTIEKWYIAYCCAMLNFWALPLISTLHSTIDILILQHHTSTYSIYRKVCGCYSIHFLVLHLLLIIFMSINLCCIMIIRQQQLDWKIGSHLIQLWLSEVHACLLIS